MTDIATIPSALQSATGTIHRAVDTLKKDANVVARSTAVESPDTLNALIYTQAAAKLIAASDEMTKSLLDIHA